MTATSCFLGILLSGCESEESKEARQAKLERFVVLLQEWKRDSAAIDSLARLVDIDSMIKLKRAVLRSGDIRPYDQELSCEYARIARQHGDRPAGAAQHRVNATFTAGELARFEEINREGGARFLHMDESLCRITGPEAPRMRNGIDLVEGKLYPLHPDSVMPPRISYYP